MWFPRYHPIHFNTSFHASQLNQFLGINDEQIPTITLTRLLPLAIDNIPIDPIAFEEELLNMGPYKVMKDSSVYAFRL
jgi:hypothetical protein